MPEENNDIALPKRVRGIIYLDLFEMFQEWDITAGAGETDENGNTRILYGTSDELPASYIICSTEEAVVELHTIKDDGITRDRMIQFMIRRDELDKLLED